jgi:hypothetical protein
MDYAMKPEKDLEEVAAEVKELLRNHNLGYPFVIKLLQASRTTHAHSFYVVSLEEGLLEALKFEGFVGEHLLF